MNYQRGPSNSAARYCHGNRHCPKVSWLLRSNHLGTEPPAETGASKGATGCEGPRVAINEIKPRPPTAGRGSVQREKQRQKRGYKRRTYQRAGAKRAQRTNGEEKERCARCTEGSGAGRRKGEKATASTDGLGERTKEAGGWGKTDPP